MTAEEAGPLAALLRQRIAAHGPIPVAEFMAAVLSHPEHGYYATRQPFGRTGDFVTAPEISPLFGAILGLWCVGSWRAMGSPQPFVLAELGPGRGTMLADAWTAAARAEPSFTAAARLHVVEASPRLRATQQHTLAALPSPPPAAWHARAEDLPAGPLLLLANEFFDALPIRQFVFRGGRWCERAVGLDERCDALAFVSSPLPDGAAVEGLPAADGDAELKPAEGDILELCPVAEALASALAGRLCCEPGAALIIDYGHPRTAFGDTLQAVRGHRYADPLAEPGACDLSHHVDFQRLRQAAEREGAQVCGPVSQGLFLSRLGLAHRAEECASAAPPEQVQRIRSAVRRLLHPGGMGLLFKTFAIAHPALPVLPGFAVTARQSRA